MNLGRSAQAIEAALPPSQETQELRFAYGVEVLPHPDKDNGGEDSFFANSKALGVFDGVGGWRAHGIDAGRYARSLAHHTEDALEQGKAVEEALSYACEKSTVVGSSTACVMHLHGRELRSLNIGDSGFLVIRNGMIVGKSTEKRHSFHTPYQLGWGPTGRVGDLVADGTPFAFNVEVGDMILVGTDGLWDNVYPDTAVHWICRAGIPRIPTTRSSSSSNALGRPPVSEITAIDWNARMAHAAHEIALRARRGGLSATFRSPFASRLRERGENVTGGKLDDVTVICATITTDV